MKKVFYVAWTLSLNKRFPNGCSLHLNNEMANNFVKDYYDTIPESKKNNYPFPLPIGNFQVDRLLYQRIIKSKNGIRLNESESFILRQSKSLVSIL